LFYAHGWLKLTAHNTHGKWQVLIWKHNASLFQSKFVFLSFQWLPLATPQEFKMFQHVSNTQNSMITICCKSEANSLLFIDFWVITHRRGTPEEISSTIDETQRYKMLDRCSGSEFKPIEQKVRNIIKNCFYILFHC
jgi:hypothetical protein